MPRDSICSTISGNKPNGWDFVRTNAAFLTAANLIANTSYLPSISKTTVNGVREDREVNLNGKRVAILRFLSKRSNGISTFEIGKQ